MVLDTHGAFSGTTSQQLSDAFGLINESLTKKSANRLGIFFHGINVSIKDGTNSAETLLPPYLQSGAYPFFPIYDTAAGDEIAQNWYAILTSALFGRLHQLITKAMVNDDYAGDRSYAQLLASSTKGDVPLREGLTPAQEQSLREQIDNDPVLKPRVAKLVATAQALNRSPHAASTLAVTPLMVRRFDYVDPRHLLTLINTRPAAELTPSTVLNVFGKLGIIYWIGERVIHRHTHPGITTITEEVARAFAVGPLLSAIWYQMIDTIDKSFTPNATAGGYALASQVAGLLRARNGDLPLTLIGHSGGAIFISRFLTELSRQLKDATFDWQCDVVLMASAERTDDWGNELNGDHSNPIAYAKHVRALRTFNLLDQYERNDSVLDYLGKPVPKIIRDLYPCSILYLISGLLIERNQTPDGHGDEPLVGMERFYGDQFTNVGTIRTLHKFIAKQTDGRVQSPTGATTVGIMSNATTHGNVPYDPLAILSTVDILKNGLPLPAASLAH